ncbi:hypothetical protein [Allocoleopsis franciscana]|uniref:DUF1868 domain-containing protein n=1 Tax=Allocoleopsis franciscana PCC 7113 TaxID=1173027 RepID=K9WE11_9CYAN|nr:hypothetical protein [Allocoleopsis franciscana]AFZ17767.1 hypothetical protein Mic7113_1913 [Allocoleopsis franciscana PCC 7113]
MDETFQTYLNRVARLTLPATYKSQLQHIQESPKFKPLPDGSRQPVPFPGYSVVTPPWEEESENSAFYTPLQVLQKKLLQELDPGLIVLVPPESFHLTLADLIWDSAFRDRESQNPKFEEQLQVRIEESFQQYQKLLSSGNPICWQLLGIMVRPRAIAVCLAPQDEDSYKRMLDFRRSIYQSSGLIALGIEQQYHFTAHITLGYFGEISPELDRDRLADTLSKLSQEALEEESAPLCVRRVELRKFDDMVRYYRKPDWPILEF